MSDTTKSVKTPPKGVRKGGTRFPRYSLKDAIPWAKKLVSKTHLGPQTSDIVFASVVGSKSTTGEIKVSALKQFNLMDGTSKAYVATELARTIESAPKEETPRLLEQAALAPDVFKALFQTFHGDEVSVAKLKQRAADLKVHPDETARCIKLYVESLQMAGLVDVAGDIIRHRGATASQNSQSVATESGDLQEDEGLETKEDEADATIEEIEDEQMMETQRPRAVFNVTVNLDSSLDTEKLEKQLKLLKRYGAI